MATFELSGGPANGEVRSVAGQSRRGLCACGLPAHARSGDITDEDGVTGDGGG